MAKVPGVSIILPTYNRAHLLPRAIRSVMNQHYQDWELLIWDDGSTDSTTEVVRSCKDSRIRYFREENHGMSYALNRSIENAKANLIAFLDDDDVWSQNKLKLQTTFLNTFPQVDMVFGNFLNTNQITGISETGFSQNKEAMQLLYIDNVGEKENLIRGYFLNAISKDNFIAFDTVMIRCECLSIIGEFNESLRNGMDFEYWWRFGLMSKKAAFTTEMLMHRFKVPGSLSGKNPLTLLNHMKALDSCGHYSDEFNSPDSKELLKAQYRNTWQLLMAHYGQQGDLPATYAALRKSLSYGFRPGTIRLLISSLVTGLRSNRRKA